MNKDVIYIDTEDDITAIIGKIKDSKEKIVALVPPKRIGILQSAVNLRLLARTAENSKKHLVLVTNNKALIALSASALIPVAKNLQSKPEIAEIAALIVDDNEDIIDGSMLPVGDLAKAVDVPGDKESDIVKDIKSLDIDDEIPKPVNLTPNKFKKSKAPKNDVKIPNFSRFRKKLFIGMFVGVLLIAFLVWALLFAPAAKVIITAKTTMSPVSVSVKLGGTESTDISKSIIQTISKQIEKPINVEFEATGKKDVGTKATGSITIQNCDYSEGFTLPVGTKFTNSDGYVFTNSSAVSVPGFSGASSACTLSGSTSGKAIVQVQAMESGVAYNNSGVSYFIGSIPDESKVEASGSAMAGGTTKIATIVTADDIQKASQALVDLSTDDAKKQLISQFTNGESVIPDSFAVDMATPVSAPAIGEEATSKAKLTSKATYSMMAIAKSELQVYLKDALTKQITSDSRRIYDDGIDKVTLSGYSRTDQVATINIATVGQIGPVIDESAIKEAVKGKRYGEAQSIVGNIEGVSDVDVKFSYFWVRTIPNNINKIDIEFKLQNE
ncbi:MAG: hypothetical protein PWQ10_399 [Patescibacteria group bacterium]|nr:hypothetical protein [Patescibacteria group bacterium]